MTLDLNVEMNGGRERSLCCQHGPWSPEEKVAESRLLHGRVNITEEAATVSEILDIPVYMTRKMAVVSLSFGEFGGYATVEKSFKNKPFTIAPTPSHV